MIDKGTGTVPNFCVSLRGPVLWSPSPKTLIMDSPCFRGGLSFRTVPRNSKNLKKGTVPDFSWCFDDEK